ncbi:tripartite motif-containing protein 16 [Nematolebias whitei]|uniref:tripartite motif-containing protein 16 n=1 Tax=Nematolebias whitei TaxID=451745 RepID=UPI001898DF90|nr:tripartite motif-containing protein 16 [Nematolebias whitei]
MSPIKPKLDQETISCSICLDLLKDPVTIPCGHSYCLGCIQTHWDRVGKKRVCSCPQCRKDFKLRPDLVKNIMLAELVEELKKIDLQAAPDYQCYAGPEDVSCDVCSDRKLKAAKSCLDCLVSFCEKHLQPHHEAPPLQKHQLVEPSKKLQENICSSHDEVMKIFCRTDQQCICYLCAMDGHKGHETVHVSAGRAEKQKELEASRQQIQQRIQDQEKDVKLLQEEVEAINVSADQTMKENKGLLSKLIKFIKKKRSDMKQRIRSQKEYEVRRVRKLQEKLEQEITELKRKDAELEQLSHTQDHNHFLHNYQSVSALGESPHSSSIEVHPRRYFERVTAAVEELRDKLEELLNEEWTSVRMLISDVDVLLPATEPDTRADFLVFSRDLTLDPNTANEELVLSEGNQRATCINHQQTSTKHPYQFTHYHQVLSKKGLTGRCYWEVEWSGGDVCISASYQTIKRQGPANECAFGFNDQSWALSSTRRGFKFDHDNHVFVISGPGSSRVGVYLDHRAGVLSFYSVSETMTLLHRVQTTFTQPLHAGVRFFDTKGTSAELVKLK